MFTLIKREIQDHIVFFIGAVILSIILVVISLPLKSRFDPQHPPLLSMVLGIPAVTITILGLCVMGATQMYTDRTRKISAFLSTLPVSRNRILLARIITGILAILTLLIPITLAAVILLRLLALPIPIYSGMVFEISIAAFLMAFACYCIGLQTGWNLSKIMPTLSGLLLTCMLVPLIYVKGFGLHIIVILVLFIVASLLRIWQKFMSTSL